MYHFHLCSHDILFLTCVCMHALDFSSTEVSHQFLDTVCCANQIENQTKLD